MNVIRWGVGLAVALTTTTAAVVTAPMASAAVPNPVPAVLGGVEAIGMTEHGTQLVAFNTADPAGLRMLGSVKGINSEKLIGIDFRPKENALYAVGITGTIFRINPETVQATKVGKLTIKPSGSNFDIDFTAAGDRLRIISDTAQNLRQPFGTSGPSGKTVKDPNLSRRYVHALGYSDGTGALGVDSTARQIVKIDGASGKVSSFGPANGLPHLKKATSSTGLDIVGGNAYTVVNADSYHTLFKVDTTNGSVQKMGVFNTGGEPDPLSKHVTDLAIRR